jgi:hypothetical protein
MMLFSFQVAIDPSKHGVSSRTTASQRVVQHEHNYSTTDSNQDAVNVKTGDAGEARKLCDESADHGTHDAQDDVHEHPLSLFVHQKAGKKTGDESQDEPSYDSHVRCSLFIETPKLAIGNGHLCPINPNIETRNPKQIRSTKAETGASA